MATSPRVVAGVATTTVVVVGNKQVLVVDYLTTTLADHTLIRMTPVVMVHLLLAMAMMVETTLTVPWLEIHSPPLAGKGHPILLALSPPLALPVVRHPLTCIPPMLACPTLV